MADDSKGGYGSGYGKRPMWQWILIYVIVAGVLYYGVYYFFMKDSYNKDASGGLYGSSSESTGTESSGGGLYNYGN